MTPPSRQWPNHGESQVKAAMTLAAFLRELSDSLTWKQAKAMVASGKISVNGKSECDPACRLVGGETVAWNMTTPDERRKVQVEGFRVVFEDGHLILIEKPEGVTSVPYERKDSGTALDLIRAHWKGQGKKATITPLYTVHRLDKDTSGLLCFAKTKLAERGLHRIFKHHLASREYLAVAHGQVQSGRIESRLVENRGDGLRGSTRRPNEGQTAITFVEAIEHLPRATFCRVRLQTGRTHQIRIHLAEQGHPLVGETVYIRDFGDRGQKTIKVSRLLLHAATLGFDHPVTGARLDFNAPLPQGFESELARLRGH